MPLASLRHHPSDGTRVKAAKEQLPQTLYAAHENSARWESIAPDDCHTRKLDMRTNQGKQCRVCQPLATRFPTTDAFVDIVPQE